MNLTRRMFVVAAGALALASLGSATPATYAAAPAASQAQAKATPAATLRHAVQQRFPKAVVQINRIGKSSSYALYVNLVAQQGATLSGGSGAQVLVWYIAAYPRQELYALYSYEKDKDGLGLWEYEFVPASKLLRRYRFSFGTSHSYAWYSWKLAQTDIAHAAKVGKWPATGVSHQPVSTPPASPHKK